MQQSLDHGLFSDGIIVFVVFLSDYQLGIFGLDIGIKIHALDLRIRPNIGVKTTLKLNRYLLYL